MSLETNRTREWKVSGACFASFALAMLLCAWGSSAAAFAPKAQFESVHKDQAAEFVSCKGSCRYRWHQREGDMTVFRIGYSREEAMFELRADCADWCYDNTEATHCRLVDYHCD